MIGSVHNEVLVGADDPDLSFGSEENRQDKNHQRLAVSGRNDVNGVEALFVDVDHHVDELCLPGMKLE